MREVDRIATEETGPNLLQMMENAGRNVALQVIDDLGDGWTQAEIVVLAGPGGNGGGGICAARHLANRRARVTLVLSDPARLSDASRFQHQVYESTPGREVRFEDLDSAPVDIIVDAVIGYGLRVQYLGRGRSLDLFHLCTAQHRAITRFHGTSQDLSIWIPAALPVRARKPLGDLAAVGALSATRRCGIST